MTLYESEDVSFETHMDRRERARTVNSSVVAAEKRRAERLEVASKVLAGMWANASLFLDPENGPARALDEADKLISALDAKP
jgi:hypothetical protein